MAKQIKCKEKKSKRHSGKFSEKVKSFIIGVTVSEAAVKYFCFKKSRHTEKR